MRDQLVPEHGDASLLSRDSTGVDQLTDDVDDSLNIHDSQLHGLVGKFRSSLKKKISIKGMSGLQGSKPTPVKRRPTADDGHDEAPTDETSPAARPERREYEEEEAEPGVVEGSPQDEGQTEQMAAVETIETVVEETTVEVKQKKKKKKRRPRDEEDVGAAMESTPVKATAGTAGVELLPDFAESPVVSVETEEISYEVTTTEEPAPPSKTKSKRRTPKKRAQQNEGDGEHQVF